MSNKEIRNKVNELLASGVAKSAVFAQLSGQGIKASRLAYYIASYAPPSLRKEHATKINILVILMLVQAVLGFFLGVSIGAKIGPEAQWMVGAFVALIPVLFAWGFHRNFVGTYNAYILLTIIQFPRQFSNFKDEPVATSIGLAIGIGLLVFVWRLRQKMFPDFAFTTPIKVKGQYVFSDRPGTQTLSISTEPAGPVHSLASLDEIAGITKSSKKPVKSRLRQKAAYSLVALIVIGSVLYLALPGKVQYALQDAIQRPFAPNFDLLPNKMKSAKQDEWIAEYRNRGYDLHCYGNLRPEEQVSKDDDYICRGIIKNAYDNIPARRVAFWFHKGELQHIKIQFPENSFAPLQGFLGRHFEGVKRLDQLPNSQLGKSAKDKSLMMWPTEHGLVVASNAPTPGQPFILGWISNEKMTRDIMAELNSQIQTNAKSTSQTSNSIGTPPAAPSAAPPSTRVSAASLPAPAQALQASPAQSVVADQPSATTTRPGQSNTLATVNKLAPNIAHIETKGNIKSTSSPGYEAQQQPAKNGPAAPPAEAPRPAPAQNIVVADAKTFQPKRRKPSDLRYCLDLPDNYAIAKCAEQ